MSSDTTFSLFSSLPTELRKLIWRFALSTWSVCRVVLSSNQTGAIIRLQHMRSQCSGRISASCREAREEMLLMGDSFDTSVVYLGPAAYAEAILHGDDCGQLSRVQHIALRWADLNILTRVCSLVGKKCPKVKTIILHEASITSVTTYNMPYTGLAARYSARLAQDPQTIDEPARLSSFRTRVKPCFTHSPPPNLLSMPPVNQ